MNNFIVWLCAVVLLVLGAMVVWFNFNPQTPPEAEAQTATYSSSEYGFSFSYPSMEFAVREYQPEAVAVGIPRAADAFDSWVNVEVVSSAGGAEYENFDAFLLERGQTLCAADGPGESIECSRLLETQPFTSEEGAEGRELYLELLWHDLEAQSTATSTFGPVYAFAMGTSTAEFMALLVYQPLPSMLAQEDPAAVEEIARTISLDAAR